MKTSVVSIEREEIKRRKNYFCCALRLLLCRATFSEVLFPIVRTAGSEAKSHKKEQISLNFASTPMVHLRLNFLPPCFPLEFIQLQNVYTTLGELFEEIFHLRGVIFYNFKVNRTY